MSLLSSNTDESPQHGVQRNNMTEKAKEEDTDLSVSLIHDSGDLDFFPPHFQESIPPTAKEDYQWDPGGQEVNSS